MSQYIDGPRKTFDAGGALAQRILVKLSSGVLAAAGLAEEFIGSIDEAAFAAGDPRSVTLRNKQGTMLCVAAGAFSAGAVVYGRAAGKVDDIGTSSAIRVGIALEAATAADDIVEVLNC